MTATLTPLPVSPFSCQAVASVAVTASPLTACSTRVNGALTRSTVDRFESSKRSLGATTACTRVPEVRSTRPPSAATLADARAGLRDSMTTRTFPSSVVDKTGRADRNDGLQQSVAMLEPSDSPTPATCARLLSSFDDPRARGNESCRATSSAWDG